MANKSVEERYYDMIVSDPGVADVYPLEGSDAIGFILGMGVLEHSLHKTGTALLDFVKDNSVNSIVQVVMPHMNLVIHLVAYRDTLEVLVTTRPEQLRAFIERTPKSDLRTQALNALDAISGTAK